MYARQKLNICILYYCFEVFSLKFLNMRVYLCGIFYLLKIEKKR